MGSKKLRNKNKTPKYDRDLSNLDVFVVKFAIKHCDNFEDVIKALDEAMQDKRNEILRKLADKYGVKLQWAN